MAGHREEAITWLGHATCVIDIGASRLVTDPLLGEHAGILRRRGGVAPNPSNWADASAVLLSHLHHDHAHAASLRSTRAVILTAPANARWADGKGLPALGLGIGQWWSPPSDPSVDISLAPAVHGDRPMPHRPNATNGFFVRRTSSEGTLRMWFAGDTEQFPSMARLPELAGGPIDVAMVPIGGWGPRLSGGHLDPAQAAQVCAMVGAKRAIPIHWGTLHAPMGRHLPRGWMDRGGVAFAAALRREAPGCEAVVLAPGERLRL